MRGVTSPRAPYREPALHVGFGPLPVHCTGARFTKFRRDNELRRAISCLARRRSASGRLLFRPEGRCTVARCKALTKAAKRCAAPEHLVDTETGFCPSHGPGASERMREAGKLGAEATRRRFSAKGLEPGERGPLESHVDAQRWLRIAGEAVAIGRLTDRQGNAVSKAISETASNLGGLEASPLTPDASGRLRAGGGRGHHAPRAPPAPVRVLSSEPV